MKRLITIIASLALAFSFVGAVSAHKDDNAKVVVCKYVGTPGEDERLQTGNNPIVVSENALEGKGFDGTFPFEFSDAQGRSIAIRYAVDSHDGDISECPGYVQPTPTPTETETTSTTSSTSSTETTETTETTESSVTSETTTTSSEETSTTSEGTSTSSAPSPSSPISSPSTSPKSKASPPPTSMSETAATSASMLPFLLIVGVISFLILIATPRKRES